MVDRKWTEFPASTILDADGDILSFVDLSEVTPALRNRKITVINFANTLYASRNVIDPFSVLYQESATVPGGAPAAGKGTLWVRDDVPNTLAFTDDAGVDHDLLALQDTTFSGLRLSYVNTTDVTIGAGFCRDSVDSYNIVVSGTLTVDITLSGAGGLDTGSPAASTWYAVHVIADSTGTNSPAGLYSLSATAPTLPAGYDVFRRVGWVRRGGGGNNLNFLQVGAGRNRLIMYRETSITTAVLTAGSAITFTDVNASAFVPSTSRFTYVLYMFDPQNANNIAYMRENGDTSDPSLVQIESASNGPTMATTTVPLDSAQLFEYRVDDASDELTLAIRGYLEEL